MHRSTSHVTLMYHRSFGTSHHGCTASQCVAEPHGSFSMSLLYTWMIRFSTALMIQRMRDYAFTTINGLL